jgi:hypothetical protein
MGLTTLPCKKEIVENPPRNSARFYGGGQGLSWAVKPRKEEEFLRYVSTVKNMEVINAMTCAEETMVMGILKHR